MSKSKEIQEILRALEKEGAIITRGRGGHYKVRHPVTRRSVNIASTPCDFRSVRNSVTRLRRLGFLLTWHRDSAQTTRRESALVR